MYQVKKFNEFFNITGYTDLDSQEQSFEKKIHKASKAIESLEDAQQIDSKMEELCRQADAYFAYARSWLEEQNRENPPSDSVEGKEIKQKTYNQAKALEEQLTTYLRILLSLQHDLLTARRYLKQEEEQLEIIPKVEWDKDTQVFIEKQLNKVPALKEEIARLNGAIDLVAILGPKLEKFEQGLYDWLGRQEGRRKYNAFLGALRGMNADKAQRVLDSLKTQKGKFRVIPGKAGKKELIPLGKKLASSYLDNISLLMLSNDRMYLKKNEVTISLDVAQKDLKKARDLINKYHHAFLKDRVKSLHKLLERLLEIGEIHHILRLYRSAFKGMLANVRSFEDVRIYEASLFMPLDYMTNEKMNDLSYISQKAERIMESLNKALQNRLSQTF